MKHITFLLALLMAFAASAQQVNPVPDYVFRNQMSVGRNAVTDTSAYISIGPRYGATKGLMPPVVNDTNAVTGTKRNGLMIFSIQKKNYLFWDSTYGRWSSISGTVDTTVMATRAWRQKGDDSLGRIINQNLIGGGPSVSYYLNHGVVTSVAGYKQMSKVAVVSVAADTSKTGNGLVAQFLTDAGDPARLEIPGGAWNFEMWFSISSIGGSVKFYVELLKYNGSTFTSIASSAVVPEEITGGTDPDLYLTSLAVPQTSLLITDRLALRVYIVDNAPGRTVTLHTQNGHLCQIVTTFSAGITALNGLTQSVQNFAVGTTGTDFNISSVTDLHTFNLPTASATNRGALSSANWTTFNNKIDGTGTTNYVQKSTGAGTIGNSQIFDNGTNVGVGNNNPATAKLQITGPSGVGGSILFQTEKASGFGSTELFQYYNTGGTDYGSNFGINVSNATNGRASIIFRGDAVSSNGTLIFNTNNTERLRIHANGRVGINTTTDAGYQLDINGTLRSVNGANFATTSGNVGIGTASPTSKLHSDGTITAGVNGGTNGSFDIKRASDGLSVANFSINTTSSLATLNTAYTFLTFATEGTEKMRINSSELLINTTTDVGDYKLQVAGNIYNTGSAVLAATSGNVLIGSTSLSGKLSVQGANANTYLLIDNVGSGENYYAANAFHQFLTAGSARMTINSSGNVGIGTASPLYLVEAFKNGLADIVARSSADNNSAILSVFNTGATSGNFAQLRAYGNTTGSTIFGLSTNKMVTLFSNADALMTIGTTSSSPLVFGTSNIERARFSVDGEFLINTTTDAGDYKLQVAGNALVSTGKLDITSNTAFGLGLSRSGTSSIAGQVFNSTGVLYYGAESSTGGSIFTGSTLYAGVIGTGANKPLQFATNNIVRMEIDSVGLVGINTTTPTQQLDVNGRARIRTVDSTATAINTLYVDVDGTVKKAQASSQMADDIISPIGSYVAAKDAGSGTVINNVSYVTNGTVKMVTVDAALYITSAGFTESVWNNIGTVPAAYRPKKTVNWNNNYIISGAEYERADNTDFTGAMDWVITQMRIKDDGSIEINGDINTNSIAVGGTGYVLIPFTISYIVK